MEAVSSFEALLQDPENNKCADCGGTPTTYASINNGVFLCYQCHLKHINLGTASSIVKPLTKEALNSDDIVFLTLGGNARFRKFLDNYALNTLPASIKYRTVAGEYYRKSVRTSPGLTRLVSGDEGGEAVDDGAAVQGGGTETVGGGQADCAGTSANVTNDLRIVASRCK